MFADAKEAAHWLSGIIDGEGYVNVRGKTRNREVRITNTDPGILDHVGIALDLLGVGYTVYDRSERERLGSKPIFDIVVSRRANLERLATFLVLRSAKAKRLRAMLDGYTNYGQMPSRELFERVYREQGQRGAAAHFSVSQGTVYNWTRRFGIAPNSR